MKKLLSQTKSIATFIIMIIIMSKGIALASSTCSSKETTICKLQSDSSYQNDCVANKDLKSFFATSTGATIGSCSEFDINKIKTYACNAGLRFLPTNQMICIKHDQNDAVSTTCGDSLDCSCNSTPNAGLNFINYEMSLYNPTLTPNYIPRTLTGSESADFAMVSPKSKTHILQSGSKLQFNLGAEIYGAEYLVDLCIGNYNNSSYQYPLTLKGKISFTNSIFTKNNYISASSLSSKVDVTCLNSNQTSETKSIAADSSFYNGSRSYESVINGSPICVVRNFFKEGAKNKIREQSFKKVTFETTIDITPNDESLLVPKPVSFCNIVKNKNAYTCTSWTSDSSDNFIKALLKDNSFFGSNTYTGACPKTCRPF